jgi:hypothetical protein
MRPPKVAIRLARWCATLATIALGTSSGLSLFYMFGVIRTVPYPGGQYAPNYTVLTAMNGGLLYYKGQGMTDVGADSPYNVIGTHWQWTRSRTYVQELWSRPTLAGDIWIPAWLIVGPPFAAALTLWVPVIRARRRRAGQCECGYDLRGLPSSICPECGRTPAPPKSL